MLKPSQNAVGVRVAAEPCFTAIAAMHGCKIKPPYIVLIMLGGKLNKGFSPSGKFLHSELEFRLSEILENSILAVLMNIS